MKRPDPSAAEIPYEITSSTVPAKNESAESLLQEMKEDLHYLALQQMMENFDPEKESQEELKEVAIFVNHLTGIILGILNLGLLLFTAIEMARTDQ